MSYANKYSFVFFGTPKFAVNVLLELEKREFLPSLIITAPDARAGRGMQYTAPPTKIWAEERNIPVLQPSNLDADFIETLQAKSSKLQADFFILAAYGKMIPESILEIPKHSMLNVHPSLLPRWRGASPIQSAILYDDNTGVSIMKMNKKMDEGPIVTQREYVRKEWPVPYSTLETELAHFGGELLAEILPEWVEWKINPTPQDESRAKYCKKISKEDGLINLNDPPEENLRKIFAYDPWPGTYFFVEKNGEKIRMKIISAELRDSKLKILRVTPEGKQEGDYDDFLKNM